MHIAFLVLCGMTYVIQLTIKFLFVFAWMKKQIESRSSGSFSIKWQVVRAVLFLRH